jgi:serine/threonine-protein kinase
MGRVWVAREENSGRLFAIKTTLSDERAGGEFWNVLLDEARIAAQVHHRSVCAIHAFEVDEQRTVPYLVMDFSDGASLYEVLNACPAHRIEPVVAASIVALLCDGLQVAHDLSDEHGTPLGVVHRDVSPQNILISSAGDVQLTDFGVAKARGRLHAATETGEIKGKLSYMAPEQVTTRDVDRRADVFALGCVLYEATVGERPFHGEDPVATMYQLLEQPLVRPTTRLAGYPSGLEEIVVKALERDLARRFQSAEEFGRELSVWIATQGRVVTERDIAAVLHDALGSTITERAQRIARAEREIDASPEPPPTEQTLDGSAASTLSLVQAARPPQTRVQWAVIAVGLSVALLLGGLGLNRFLHAETPQRVEQSVAKVAPDPERAPPVATPSAATSVTVTLRAEPAQAVLFLDDGSALPNPYKLSVAKDGISHRVRAAAAGFNERVEHVRFDGDKEVELTLSALPSGAQPRSIGTKVGSAAPVHSEAPVVRPGELPPVVKRPPRKLDSDNPFATP